MGASVTVDREPEALPLTDVLPDAEAFGAAWVTLASEADTPAEPEPATAGEVSDTKASAEDRVAEPFALADGALAVIAAGAADREALPVPDDAGADSAIEATAALAEPLTTVDAEAEPVGAVSDNRSIAVLIDASAETDAATAEIPTSATAPVAAASAPACQ